MYDTHYARTQAAQLLLHWGVACSNNPHCVMPIFKEVKDMLTPPRDRDEEVR